MNKLAPYLLTLIAGWIAAFSMPPLGLWPLLILGFCGFFYFWHKAASYRAAFTLGFLFGIGYFTTGLWWIGNALLIEGNEFWWVWPLSVIGLPALLSLFTGFFSALAKVFFKEMRISSWIGFAGLITVSEWVRGHIFTGFPWNLYGYAWSRHLEVLQAASLFGAYILTFLTVMMATAPAFIYLAQRDKKRVIYATALSALAALFLFAYGEWRLTTHPTAYHDRVSVRVVQPNIEQTMKWDPSLLAPHFEKHLILSTGKDRTPPDALFILWPETAIPPELLDNQVARQKIATLLRGQAPEAVLLSGALVREDDGNQKKYFNALLAFNNKGQVRASYAKTHLVPFGEFIPFQRWIPIRPVVRFQGFEPGKGPQTLRVNDLPGFSPLVCYEIIFPGQAVDTADRPAFLAAVTNDAWYGDSAGPRQHFFQVRIRTIEEGIPAIRSANTGISGVVDALGRVVQQSGIFETAVIDSALPQFLPPTLFSKTGNLFWFCMLIAMVGACAAWQKIKR